MTNAASPHQISAVGGFDEEAFRKVIGRNVDHYLPTFREFAASQGKWSWNWPAFLITWCWLLHRKMWGAFLVYILCVNLLVPGAVAGLPLVGVSGRNLAYSLAALIGVFFLIPGLWGDRWYYRRCVAKMGRASNKTETRDSYLSNLTKRGGTLFAPWFVWVAVVLLTALVAAISIPAWSDYTKRAPVSDAVRWGQSAMLASHYYLKDRGELPIRLDDLRGVDKRPEGISEARLDPRTRLFTMTLAGRGSLSVWISPGAPRHLGCSSPDMAADLLPGDCRGRPAPRVAD